MGDPFDVTNSDTAPSGGGVSPDFFHNLLSFGLATMSAASQPGAQFLGSLGQGGLAAMQSSRENAKARLSQQIGQESLVNSRLDTATKLNNLNWLRQQNGLPPIGLDGQVQSVQAGANAPNATDAPPKIAEPGASGGASWSPSIGSSGPNQPSAVSSPTQSATTGSIGGVPVSIYNQMNPQEQAAAMQGYAYTMHGMADVGKPYTDFAFARLKAKGVAEGETPSKIKQERAQFRELRGGNGMPSSVFDPQMNDGAGGIAAEGAQTGQVQPGQTVQGPDGKPFPVGTHYRLPPSVNSQAGSGAINLGASPAPNPDSGTVAPNSDPGVGMAAFQAGQSAGIPAAPPGAPPQAPQAPGINLPFPPPAPMGPSAPPPAAPPVPAPQAPPQAPSQAPAPTGAPAVTGAIPTELPPQQEELLKTGTHAWIEKSMPLYENANNALGSAKVIDTDIQNLPRTGMLATGATAKGRFDFAQKVNDMQRSLGVTDENLLFDPKQVATAESLNKEALRLGFADARTLGAKEAASVVDQSIKANPGLQSSPIGIRLLNSTMAEKMQRVKDQVEFQHDQLVNHGVDTIASEMDFNKKYPVSAYIQRGMSQIAPITIPPSRPGVLSGLLPGTRVKLPNDPGPGKVVPLNPDYQFSMPPTVHSLEQQGGE